MRTGLKKAQMHSRHAAMMKQWQRETQEQSPRSKAYQRLFAEARERIEKEKQG